MIIFCDFRKKESKQKLFDYFKSLDNVYKIEIKRDREVRSGNQNRYYWGVVIAMISEYTGFLPDEAHEMLKQKFLKYDKAFKSTGEAYTTARSTTDLDTWEFENYLEQCRIFAATEIEIVIPLPNECMEY